MSNKTLKSNVAETASEPRASKHSVWKYLLYALLFLSVILLTGFLRANRNEPAGSKPCIRYVETDGSSGSCLLSFDFARTPEEQAKGLGERKSLPQNRGLMFMFLYSGKQCFWMKDMQFPIDIIWINQNKEIVHVEKNVSPDTYPKTFCPNVNAQYVLEVNAGVADKLDLHQNQKIQF